MACEHELEAPVYLWLPSKVFSHEGFQQQPCWPLLKHCFFNTPITSWLFKVAHWECYVTLAFILTTLLKKKSYKFRNALGQVAHWHFITARVFISGTDSSCHASEAKLTDASVLLKLSSPWDLSDMRLWSQSLSPFSSAHTGESRASLSPGRPLFYHCWWIGSAWLGSNRAFAQTGLASSLSARLHSRMCTKMTYDELGTPNLKFRVYRHVHKWGIKCLIQPSWGTQAML